ncbi:Mth938-like domain-containing protein [Aquabacterium sp.]|uniref:Mth938-like domain-containing protein n=1 Tax=Aquabacterium sp. TaxID=1872578 RepID=UPI002489F4C4|nr:Mth938-like domain-containing protein [Aquabacterium sp.]MDI1260705.1 Mth938-like domain-containing protein [Aquabacterium sp.]
MKLQADLPEGVNVINAYTRQSVSINGQEYLGSVLVPPSGAPVPWPLTSMTELTEAHFEQILLMNPELVVLGSGPTLKFASPALMKSLMKKRIGVETMDTPAACRTYNILVGEGRRVVAALLVEP